MSDTIWRKCLQCGRENSTATWQEFGGKCPNCLDLHGKDVADTSPEIEDSMTQHNKSGAELSAVDIAVETAEKFITLVLAGQCTYYGNRIRIEVKNGVRIVTSEPEPQIAPVADAGVKRPATFSTREIRFDNYWYRKTDADVYMDSLELQLAQAQGKNVELAERVKELEFLSPAFLAAMNDVGRYGHQKYGEQNFQHRRMSGDLSRGDMDRTLPDSIAGHAARHFSVYLAGIEHDHFNTLGHQLAAVAFNAMMEFYFAGLESETKCVSSAASGKDGE